LSVNTQQLNCAAPIGLWIAERGAFQGLTPLTFSARAVGAQNGRIRQSPAASACPPPTTRYHAASKSPFLRLGTLNLEPGTERTPHEKETTAKRAADVVREVEEMILDTRPALAQ